MRLPVKRYKCGICYVCVSEFAYKRANVCMETNGLYVQNGSEKSGMAFFFSAVWNLVLSVFISLLFNGRETSVVELNKTLALMKEWSN